MVSEIESHSICVFMFRLSADKIDYLCDNYPLLGVAVDIDAFGILVHLVRQGRSDRCAPWTLYGTLHGNLRPVSP